jgi:hypothetical protein
METLHLNLIKKWFDMIKSGEKKVEYREITDYWAVRLFENWKSLKPNAKKIVLQILQLNGEFRPEEFESCIDMVPKKFDMIEFKNGFARKGIPAPCFKKEYCNLSTGRGIEKWGADPDKIYFIIKFNTITNLE